MKNLGKKLIIAFWILSVVSLLYFSLSYLNKLNKGVSDDNFFTRLFKKDKYSDYKKVINGQLLEEESATIDAVDKVSPSVVSIVVKTVNFGFFTGPTQSESGIGTGFIVDSKGLIVTNSHVVNNARGEYSVVLKDGTTYPVTKIHLDTISDLALIEISAQNLPTVELGDSDKLKVGQTAIAIGNALGRYQNTVTVGVVSGIGREFMASGGFGTRSTLQENAIQTDAALNPGNSGGPLLNLAGQVIGINVATTIGADNISFSIPVNALKPLLESFSQAGRIIRPYIGVSYTVITKEIAALRRLPEGAYITNILADSPAVKAGLVAGDIITNINGKPLSADVSIAKEISKLKVGDSCTLTVDHAGELKEITLQLEEVPNSLNTPQ